MFVFSFCKIFRSFFFLFSLTHFSSSPFLSFPSSPFLPFPLFCVKGGPQPCTECVNTMCVNPNPFCGQFCGYGVDAACQFVYIYFFLLPLLNSIFFFALSKRRMICQFEWNGALCWISKPMLFLLSHRFNKGFFFFLSQSLN